MVRSFWRGDTPPPEDAPIYAISAAAQLAGIHAQTLRQYDRLGIVTPSRTQGGGRRYSVHDLKVLAEVQRLSQEEGVSLAGIRRILELEDQVDALRSRVRELADELQRERDKGLRRVFAASPDGQITPLRPGERVQPVRAERALVVWRKRS
ncbi:heat shock protein transcriptional repressor HspR [Flexivirga oryzae]|uniref:MerR family transcriptional regulator/heat shock protein HspR n=1 Tax=Flexivirga oryzae TaxID=1794944 RepID=A0A839NA42_9MICO|nr:helix-turn-helix transcriptional regulator [Flexivirga oryzae]MBB2894097.1 MerR family transcriptional regulator/heat shock protein HspR [Flexivirga oryzae]